MGTSSRRVLPANRRDKKTAPFTWRWVRKALPTWGTGALSVAGLGLWALRNKHPGEMVELTWGFFEGCGECGRPMGGAVLRGPCPLPHFLLPLPCTAGLGLLSLPGAFLSLASLCVCSPAWLLHHTLPALWFTLSSRSRSCECGSDGPARVRRLPTHSSGAVTTSTNCVPRAWLCRRVRTTPSEQVSSFPSWREGRAPTRRHWGGWGRLWAFDCLPVRPLGPLPC